MKKINFIIAAILLAGMAFSQDYVPMAIDQAHWMVGLKDKESPMPYEYLWHYYTNGDTTVDGRVYEKVYKQLADTFAANNPPYTPFGPVTLLGLLRDDAPNKQVYGICYEEDFSEECPVNEEILLYDFSLQIGDSMNFCLAEPYYAGDTIAAITQGQMFEVDTRIFTMASRMNSYYEGIGSDFGLFEDMFEPLKNRELYHYYLYGYCRDNNCDLIVDVKENLLPEYVIKISPNPVEREFGIWIKLQNANHAGYDIEICDLLGKSIIQKEVSPGKDVIRMNATNWPNGLYILRLRSEGKVVKNEKLVVK